MVDKWCGGKMKALTVVLGFWGMRRCIHMYNNNNIYIEILYRGKLHRHDTVPETQASLTTKSRRVCPKSSASESRKHRDDMLFMLLLLVVVVGELRCVRDGAFDCRV